MCTKDFCLGFLTAKKIKNMVLNFAYRQNWYNLHLVCFVGRFCCFMYVRIFEVKAVVTRG